MLAETRVAIFQLNEASVPISHRKTLRSLLVVIGVTLCGTVPAGTSGINWTETFDDARELPRGWQSGITGNGAAKWQVIAEPSAPSPPNALRQSGKATFSWAARVGHPLEDGFAQVAFKPVSGREDQAAGLVFRFQDANNYYVVRANALEGNVVLYKMVDGRRSSLPVKGRLSGYGLDIEVPRAHWSTLRVEFSGRLFRVFLNGRHLFDVEDGTFAAAGATGVWTKADSVTLFDDFSYGSTRQRSAPGGV